MSYKYGPADPEYPDEEQPEPRGESAVFAGFLRKLAVLDWSLVLLVIVVGLVRRWSTVDEFGTGLAIAGGALCGIGALVAMWNSGELGLFQTTLPFERRREPPRDPFAHRLATLLLAGGVIPAVMGVLLLIIG